MENTPLPKAYLEAIQAEGLYPGEGTLEFIKPQDDAIEDIGGSNRKVLDVVAGLAQVSNSMVKELKADRERRIYQDSAASERS